MGQAPLKRVTNGAIVADRRRPRPEHHLFGDEEPIQSASAGAWRVLHTKPRQEKALAETLRAADLRFYLPTVRERREYGHRWRETDRPLFPSYLFLRGSREQAWFAQGTRRVVSVIEVPDQAEFVRELEQIRRALVGRATLDPYPYLKRGRRVRVRSGPFKGVEGVVDERARPERLILKVDALGRAVSLEIDACLLEPAD